MIDLPQPDRGVTEIEERLARRAQFRAAWKRGVRLLLAALLTFVIVPPAAIYGQHGWRLFTAVPQHCLPLLAPPFAADFESLTASLGDRAGRPTECARLAGDERRDVVQATTRGTAVRHGGLGAPQFILGNDLWAKASDGLVMWAAGQLNSGFVVQTAVPNPFGIAFNEAAQQIVVGGRRTPNVSDLAFLDRQGRTTATATVPGQHSVMALDPDTGVIYLVSRELGNIRPRLTSFDPSTGQSTLLATFPSTGPDGRPPTLGVDPTTHELYVLSGFSFLVIDLRTGLQVYETNLPQGLNPGSFDPNTGRFALSRIGAAPYGVIRSEIVLFDGRARRQVRSPIVVEGVGGIASLAADFKAGRLYFTQADTPGMSVLDANTGEPLARLDLPGPGPNSLLVDSGRGRLYAVGSEHPWLTVFDSIRGLRLDRMTIPPLASAWAIGNEGSIYFLHSGSTGIVSLAHDRITVQSAP